MSFGAPAASVGEASCCEVDEEPDVPEPGTLLTDLILGESRVGTILWVLADHDNPRITSRSTPPAIPSTRA